MYLYLFDDGSMKQSSELTDETRESISNGELVVVGWNGHEFVEYQGDGAVEPVEELET